MRWCWCYRFWGSQCRSGCERLTATVAAMTVLEGIGLFLAGYLILVGRSAWKQGELRQFALSLAIVAGLCLMIIAIVYIVDLAGA